MNADAFRHFYDYHINQNRFIWDTYIATLPQDQFIQPIGYSIGSIRNHVVHLMGVDDTWFSGLRGEELPEWLNADDFIDKQAIRDYWDKVEQKMRDYLAGLRDDMLFTKPFPAGEDENLMVWQVLIHVVNHGTDHRAQLLRALHDVGVKTGPQDYIFYVYDHP